MVGHNTLEGGRGASSRIITNGFGLAALEMPLLEGTGRTRAYSFEALVVSVGVYQDEGSVG